MFTGLVEGLGRLARLQPEGAALRLTISPPAALLSSVAIGDSIAINGCCLTVVEIAAGRWSFQAGPETLARTNLGRLVLDDRVNLERSLPVDGRLGGHFVQGHIDGIGHVGSIMPAGEWLTLWIRVGETLSQQMVSKGSVAVDGVSLTVVDVERDRFSVALIPHTLAMTTLGMRQPGDAVNIETDLIGKYVQKLLGQRG